MLYEVCFSFRFCACVCSSPDEYNLYRILVLLPYHTSVTRERRQTQKSTHVHYIHTLLWRIAAEIFMEWLP